MAKPHRPSEMKVQAGLRLKAARLALDFPRADAFAHNLGVSGTAYSNYETGERLADVAMCVRLLEKTGIGPDWVFAGHLGGVPWDLAERLREEAARVGAVVGGPVAKWPMASERSDDLRPPAAAPQPKRAARPTLHERQAPINKRE